MELQFPMETRVVRWADNAQSASIVLGPLTYSLKIAEEYRQEITLIPMGAARLRISAFPVVDNSTVSPK